MLFLLWDNECERDDMMNGFNPQINVIDRQILEERNKINELEKQRIQAQYAQPTILNQTIQAGPTSSGIRYAESIDDVNREMIYTDTLFVNRDFTNMWYKTPQGKVRPFLLEEIIPKDDKDLRIESLEKQVRELLEERKIDANKHTGDNAATTSSVSEPVQTITADETE